MSRLIAPVQPLILTQAGAQPTVPNPPTIMPTDSRFNLESDLMIGQMAYNIVDDKFFYRSQSGIRNLLTPTDIDTSNVELWRNDKIYKAGNVYVTYYNLDSTDEQFQVEGIYRCTADTAAGESPETHPSKWKYIGQQFTVDPSTIIDTINTENADQYNPTKENGYAEGSIVSYRNESSSIPQFQEWALYLAISDIDMGVSPEDDPINWDYQGIEVQEQVEYPTVRLIAEDSIPSVTSAMDGDIIITRDTLKFFRYSENENSWVELFRAAYGKKLEALTINNQSTFDVNWNTIYSTEVYSGITQFTLRILSDSSAVRNTREAESVFIVDNTSNSFNASLNLIVQTAGQVVYGLNTELPIQLTAGKRYKITIDRESPTVCTVKAELLDDIIVYDTSLWEEESSALIRPKNGKLVGVESIDGLSTVATTNDYNDLDNLPDIESMLSDTELDWEINEW